MLHLCLPLMLLLTLALVGPGCTDDETASAADSALPAPDNSAPDLPRAVDRGADLPAVDLRRDQLLCPEAGSPDSGAPTVSISGHVHNFTGSPSRLSGATIWVLEQPCRRTVSGKNGFFEIKGLRPNTEVTLRMSLQGWAPLQSATHDLGAGGISTATFQAPSDIMYKALAAIAKLTPDPTRCQMVTTVTRIGKDMTSPGAHGEAGVTVTLSPSLPASQGPIYFNKLVLPVPSRTETSEDGGVLFANAPPGDYSWTAHKTGVKFRKVKMKCRAGWLVNAAPPWGLQAYK